MANMSYCAFENTYGDLNQCIALMWEEVDGGYELSQSEWEYAQMLVSKLEKLKGLVATRRRRSGRVSSRFAEPVQSSSTK